MLATRRFFNPRTADPARKPELPPRIRALVREQQDANEVLTSWIQLALVTTFALLYAVSPKTFSAETFAPVPWALGAYFTFTVVRLVLARRRRLPRVLLYVSAVGDIVLLLGLVWTFHLQYGQPASFYLKVPTLLYVFIFIALRALQYDVRFVIATGSAAVLGWLWMAWYAVNPANGGFVTRDYVLYMTSNSVLLGAEFDKVISIIAVTAILAIAISRSGRLLVESVVEGSAVRDLSRFVPRGVASRVKQADEVAAGQGEERQATMLFTDIEGFTTVSETLSPRELIDTLNEYFAVVAGPVEKYGGVVNGFMGDALLVTYNLPEPHSDHAGNAVRTALEIQRLLKGRTFGPGVTLNSRIGINTGLVVGGLVGAGDRLAYTVYGDEVNLAARLEPLNKDYGTRILVSESTRELAGADRFPFRRMGEVTIRGRSGTTVVYALDDVEPGVA